ncbi:cellulose binding domain-containing protein [Streptomyces sp. NBC_00433]
MAGPRRPRSIGPTPTDQAAPSPPRHPRAPSCPGTADSCGGSRNRSLPGPDARRSPRNSPHSSCAWPTRIRPGATHPHPGRTATPRPPTGPTGTCGIGYQVTGSWSGGFQGEIVINNTGSAALTGWTPAFTFTAGQTITQMWGGTPAQNGSTVTVTPVDYTRTIPAGASVSISFLANQGSTNPAPATFTLNGGPCSTA